MAEKRAQSCAACKHQRKKCKPESCLLAPFFPAERGREFQAVHKVFGVSNVQKMIQVLDTHESRAIAAESLIWEATWRLREPIHGCWADHKRLQDQVRALQEQAQLLKLQLSKLMRINANFEQQNYGALQSANVGYGGIGTTNNDMINHINYCSSSSRAQTQHNLDYSFTDQFNTSIKPKVQLMNKFNQGKIDHGELNSLDVDIRSLCDTTSWEEVP